MSEPTNIDFYYDDFTGDYVRSVALEAAGLEASDVCDCCFAGIVYDYDQGGYALLYESGTVSNALFFYGDSVPTPDELRTAYKVYTSRPTRGPLEEDDPHDQFIIASLR